MKVETPPGPPPAIAGAKPANGSVTQTTAAENPPPQVKTPAPAAPSKPAAKPARAVPLAGKASAGAAPPREKKTFSISTGIAKRAARLGNYGPGGVGKTTLAGMLGAMQMNPVFIDVEEGTDFYDVARVGSRENPIVTLNDLRDALHSKDLLAPFGAVVIDTLTKVEEFLAPWVLENITNEKGKNVATIKHYGWGDGEGHLFDTMNLILGDLDNIARAGKMIVLNMHECVEMIQNPEGENWICYQPRLLQTKKGQIRARVREWLDHLCHVTFDVHVTDKGRAQGGESRTIYTTHSATRWAKNRGLEQSYVFTPDDYSFWNDVVKSLA